MNHRMYLKIVNKIKLIILVLIIIMSNVLNAQNKIAVSKRAPINLNFSQMYKAGMDGQIIADDSQWLNYTVLLEASDPSAYISVDIASGSVPEGLELYVEAGGYKGFSRGKMGTPTGRIQLTHMPRILVDNIGNSYTGSGRNEGHQLTFYFKITDYAKLEPGICTIYVQYTINQ